jgi:hypothetical protein
MVCYRDSFTFFFYLLQTLDAKFNRNPLSIYGDEKYGYYLPTMLILSTLCKYDRLCGLVVRDPGFDSRRYQIF